MPWATGTDATNKIKDTLVTWLDGRLRSSPYKARMPRRHFKVAAPKGSERIAASIRILVYTEADEIQPHEFETAAGRVMEEHHRIAIDVRSDEKGAKADETAKVAAIVRQVLSKPTERQALIALGIYNVRERAEQLFIEGVEFNRPINLTCTTDVLL